MGRRDRGNLIVPEIGFPAMPMGAFTFLNLVRSDNLNRVKNRKPNEGNHLRAGML